MVCAESLCRRFCLPIDSAQYLLGNPVRLVFFFEFLARFNLCRRFSTCVHGFGAHGLGQRYLLRQTRPKRWCNQALEGLLQQEAICGQLDRWSYPRLPDHSFSRPAINNQQSAIFISFSMAALALDFRRVYSDRHSDQYARHCLSTVI